MPLGKGGITKTGAQNEFGAGRLFPMALVALLALLAVNLFYPDTVIGLVWKLGPLKFSPIRLAFVMAAPLIILYIWNQRAQLRLQLMDLFLLATMSYMLIRGLAAANDKVGTALILGYIGYGLLVYYGTAVIIQRKSGLQAVVICLVTVGFVVVALGLMEFFLGRNVLYSGILNEGVNLLSGKRYVRSGSTLGHPLALGLFLVQVAPFFLIFFAKAGSMAKRIAWGAAVMAVALTLLVTFSKGAWFAAVAVSVVTALWLFWSYPGSRRSIILLSLAVIVSIATFSAVFHKETGAGTISWARKGESFNPRKYMWSRSTTVIQEYPVFGTGIWQGGSIVTLVDFKDFGKSQPSAIDNLYLTILVEQGILGMSLLLATMALLFRQTFILCKSKGEIARMAMALMASMSAVFICGLVMDSLMLWSGMIMFWLTAGMVRGLYETRSRKFEPGLLR